MLGIIMPQYIPLCFGMIFLWKNQTDYNWFYTIMYGTISVCSSVVERHSYKVDVDGSSPSRRTKWHNNAEIAKVVTAVV